MVLGMVMIVRYARFSVNGGAARGCNLNMSNDSEWRCALCSLLCETLNTELTYQYPIWLLRSISISPPS